MKLNHKIFGQGPPLIILHGLFGMLDNWRTIARKLQNSFQCILVDLRNHGKSPHTVEMSYPLMSEDLLELMNDMQLQSAHILGHSMGGKVAMKFAIQYPERVSKLIVVDIAPRGYEPHHQAVLEAIGKLDPAKMTSRSDAEDHFRKYLKDDPATIGFLSKNLDRQAIGGFAWKANMPVLIRKYEALMEGIDSGIFDGPALFIKGELSGSMRDDDMEGIRSLFPAATMVTVAGAGHWVHADKPVELIEAVIDFLQPD